ncbi:hypothetical protein PMSD_25785 [Paenibacillus macquariensis subsp. defensor]|nr:hypothetical protein PMSD_25785 [Paenibacillus macquariensis subsp. defensor]
MRGSVKSWIVGMVLVILLEGISLSIGLNNKVEATQERIQIRQIAAGEGVAYALDTSHTLWTWGGTDRVTALRTPAEIEFFKGKEVIDVRSIHDDTIVLLEDGTVWILTYINGEKSEFEQLSALQNIKSISSGANEYYATDNSGQIWTWSNSIDGDTTPRVLVGMNGSEVKQIAGRYAVKKDGTVWYWIDDSKPPTQIDGLNETQKIAVGNYGMTIYAIGQGGQVWGWGKSKLGNIQVEGLNNKPVRIDGLDHVIDLAGGKSHFAVVKEDGSVWTWGANDVGQLGNATNVASAKPSLVKGLDKATAVNSGVYADYTLAILENGTLWSWGSNVSGQSGSTMRDNKIVIPVKVKLNLAAVNASEQFNASYVGAEGNQFGTVATDGNLNIVAVYERELTISNDGGVTWHQQAHSSIASAYNVRYVNDRFYLWTYNTNEPKFYWSIDGLQWTEGELPRIGERTLMLHQVQWVNGQYVIIAGFMGELYSYAFTSANGIDWQKTAQFTDTIKEITWNGIRYTAIADGYEYYGSAKNRNQFIVLPSDKRNVELIVYTADNLSSWTKQSGSKRTDVRYKMTVNGVPRITYNVTLDEVRQDGTVVLIDQYENELVSKDGITFKLNIRQDIFSKVDGRSKIFFIGNQYLIYSKYWRNEGKILVSKDKVHWTERSISNIPLGLDVVKTSKGLVGFSYDGQRAFSTDGLNWTITKAGYQSLHFGQVEKINGRYLAVGSEMGQSVSAVAMSKDGTTWSQVLRNNRLSNAGTRDDMQSVAWSGQGYTAVGGRFTWTSKDGLSWKKKDIGYKNLNLKRIVWTGKQFVVLGEPADRKDDNSALLTSKDGVTWKKSLDWKGTLTDIAVHGPLVIAVGSNNNQAVTLTSSDATNWKKQTFTLGKENKNWGIKKAILDDAESANGFTNVQWVKDKFVIMSDDIYTSMDGSKWTVVKGDYSEFIMDDPSVIGNGRLLWTGSKYIYYRNHTLASSSDLVNWIFYKQDLYNPELLKDMIWTGTDLLGVGESGLMIRISEKK